MKLTFAIPAYNEEATISQCLNSVFNELRGKKYDTEIIVINNASTDRTKEIALSFSDVKVVDEPRKGLTWARQAGFLAASGDIIANIDADTTLPKGWLDKVFLEFSKNDNLVALSGPHVYRDISKLSQLSVRLFYYLGYISYLFNYYLIKKGSMLQGGNFIVKKSALEKIGGYSLNFDFYEDTDIASRIYKVGHVKFTFGLPIYASGRRFKKENLVFAGIKYAINHFWVLTFKKPFSKGYVDIRESGGK
jgi:glycosyltransferase involved in cell wall biosynthesis